MPDIFMIGGPDGAGKTTAAQELVPADLGLREFVNANEIARGLSPFNPGGVALKAGRLMLERIAELRQRGVSFAFETTCAGRRHGHWLRLAKQEGYRFTVIFLWLPSAAVAEQRVGRRVSEGGHAIAPGVIRRRYGAGLKNLRDIYLPLADISAIYDTTGDRRLIAEKVSGRLIVHDMVAWTSITGADG